MYVKERDELIQLDIENPHPHAIRGAVLLQDFNYFEEISEIVLHHHRYYDYERGLKFANKDVPFESFVIHLADRIEILFDEKLPYFIQSEVIKGEILKRNEKVFHPSIVDAFIKLSDKESFWLNLESRSFEQLLLEVVEDKKDINTDLELLERVALLFSNIVDSKSPYTASHSKAVGEVAFAICKLHHIDEDTCAKVKVAGLFHDIGKIGIPNEIVEKETKLSDYEFQLMKSHAYYTHQILGYLKGLEDIRKWASMHHEKHDGSGYPFHIEAKDFTVEMDILAIADVFTALSENRPYREGLSNENIMIFLENEFSENVNKEVLNTLRENLEYLTSIRKDAQNTAYDQYNKNIKKISQMTDRMASKKMVETQQKLQPLH